MPDSRREKKIAWSPPGAGDGTTHNGVQRPAAPSRRRDTSSFEARFGRVILEHGIAAIPAGLFHFQRLLGLDAKHLWFLAYILSCKWDADLPYPSLNKMERCTGVDIQALYRYKKALVSQGYLQVFRRFTESGGYDTDAYDFSALFDRLEECIIAEQPQPNPIRSSDPALERGEYLEKSEIDTSFVARYGRVIVRYGVAAIPRGIFTFQRALALTPQQVWFVAYILSFKWDAALPYPSIEKMSLNTGYNRAYLHEIKASLVQAGYLKLVHRTNEMGGQDSNAYDFSGLLDAVRAQLDAERGEGQAAAKEGDKPLLAAGADDEANRERYAEPPARRRSRLAAQARSAAAAQTPEGPTPGIKEHTGVAITEHTRASINGHNGVGISRQTLDSLNEQTGGSITEQTAPAIAGQRGVGSKRQTDPVQQTNPPHLSTGKRGQVSVRRHESETVQAEELNRYDSNQPPPMQRKDVRSSSTQEEEQIRYSPYIASVVSDFSNELGDSGHIFSNVTQALRIYSRSGLEEEDFSTLLFEARKVVRSYQGKHGASGIGNKMAYFFATLKRLADA